MSDTLSEAGPSSRPHRSTSTSTTPRHSSSATASARPRSRSGLRRASSALSTRSDSSNISSATTKIDWHSGEAYDYIQPDDQISAFLHCPICLGPFYEPYASDRCSHTFCKLCITTALSQNADAEHRQDDHHDQRNDSPQASRCPSCRTDVTLDDFRPTALLIKNMVDTLAVRCPNRSKGCQHTCERHLLRGHLASECQYEYVDEKLDGGKRCACRAKVMRKDWLQHGLACPKRKLTCQTCRTEVLADQMERHCQACSPEPATCNYCGLASTKSTLPLHITVCREAPISCRHASYGCDWTGPRWQLEADPSEPNADSSSTYHLSSTCRYEPLKAFFLAFTRQTAELRQENASLRQRLEEVESKQRSSDWKLEDCVHSLGSWYRSAGQIADRDDFEEGTGALSATAVEWEEFPLDAQNWEGDPHRPSLYRPGSSFAPSEMGSLSRMQSDDRFISERGRSNSAAAISPLPPPRPGSTSTSTRPLPVLSPPTSRSAPSSTHTDLPPSHHPRPPQPSPIAHNPSSFPLNSSSLTTLLTSLESSIHSLSTAITSLERRYEKSHLTAVSGSFEAVRASEETASLRHVVHAMRMQIHQILMTQQRVALFWPPTPCGQGQPEGASASGGVSGMTMQKPGPGAQAGAGFNAPMLVRRWAGFDQTKL